jgi:hypothetical protein
MRVFSQEVVMRRSIVAALLAILVVGVPAFAHEGHVHKLMGTITAVHVDKSHVEMKDNKGAAQSFYVVKETKIVKGKEAVALGDLKAGTRVVVEAKTTDGRLVASEVRVGGTTPAAAAEHKH